ncbi:Protein FAM92A [Amphibalanus amphitrite]|uniref:Protein FAM92A n=2 Tax=Amphibalanus amphitrite TaxID=1232801 RepID=A0A6A4X5M7_AMPAM|nr:Protein FAM92A [Amphibalanus amphitrite]
MRATGPANYRQIALAETELQRAAIDVARTHAALEESMEYFEMKKLRDLRRFLLEFCHAMLNYHARNIELYSRAYRMVKDMDVDTDLDDFRKAMQFPAPPSSSRKSALDVLSQSSAAGLSQGRKAGTGASPRSTPPRYAAGNENSPYNQRHRSRSMDCDREPGARLRVQSRPRMSDNDVFQQSYGNGSRDRLAARPSRSRSS